MARLHSNKEISKAIEYALDHGFRIVAAGRSSHIKLSLYCPVTSREGCKVSVFSTPRSPEQHAKDIRDKIDRCLIIHPRLDPPGRT